MGDWMNVERMPAVVVHETGKRGAWNLLALEEAPMPLPSADEALVRVEACSVNRADLLQRRGLYPPPPGASPILGLDFAGIVEAVPASALGGWKPGDRVYGITGGGGYGRYAAVRGDHLVEIPENLSFIDAAAAAEVFFTAWLNLFMEAELQEGEVLLVHGGGSGVGTAALQLARNAGARVIVTAGDGEKIARCLALGASYGINYKEEDFAVRVKELTGGVDVVLDWIGASYLERHLDILNPCGRLVVIGFMGGHRAEVSLAPLLSKRLRLIGSVLRSRTDAEKAVLAGEIARKVNPQLRSGAAHPVVDRVYPMGEAEQAHLYMNEGRHFGKIVLAWEP